MSFDTHDPKWTAYVLGELNDVERSEVEAELAVDPAARAFVAELRGAVGQLTSELTADRPAITVVPRARAPAPPTSRRPWSRSCNQLAASGGAGRWPAGGSTWRRWSWWQSDSRRCCYRRG